MQILSCTVLAPSSFRFPGYALVAVEKHCGCLDFQVLLVFLVQTSSLMADANQSLGEIYLQT
jgi:hypothetical protein